MPCSNCQQRVDVISEAAWNSQKDLIKQYYDQQLLLEVIRAMCIDHDFHASEQQYKRRLDKWDFRKYVTKHQMQQVSETTPGSFQVDGTQVARRKVIRFRKRQWRKAQPVSHESPSETLDMADAQEAVNTHAAHAMQNQMVTFPAYIAMGPEVLDAILSFQQTYEGWPKNYWLVWSTLLRQAEWHSDAVKHAVMTISILYEYISKPNSLRLIKSSFRDFAFRFGLSRRYPRLPCQFFEHYSKSCSLVRIERCLKTVFLCAFVFSIIEKLRANWKNARKHQQAMSRFSDEEDARPLQAKCLKKLRLSQTGEHVCDESGRSRHWRFRPAITGSSIRG